MLKDLPILIEPKRLALQGEHLKGQVALAQMLRLHDSICELQGAVQIDWIFTVDDEKRPIIQGTIKVALSLPCQRCLQPMPWSINAAVALIIGEEENCPTGYDVLSLTTPQIELMTLIEDELILALPIVIMHTTCSDNEHTYVADNNIHNPFWVLSKLKTDPS
ncbi:MAG: DUF177 domain-containing protein [Thiomargarita sp.]|nr:DUF177 domain-containing protein [Thiomargarita sp.]